MVTQPKNLEDLEQGGTHDFDITFLNRAKSLGGVPVNPDGYDATNPAASVTATVEVYDASASDPDDAANWSTPAGALNPPTVASLLDGGSTGRVLARVSAPSNAKLSSLLLSEDDLRWGLHWSATINGVAVEFFEFLDIVAVGAGDFGDGLFCSVAEVRQASGFTHERDIDDDAVKAMIRRAQAEFLHDVATRRVVRVLKPVNAALTIHEAPKDVGWLFPDSFAELEDATEYTLQYLDDDDALTSVGIVSKDTARNRVTAATALASDEEPVLTGWFCHVQDPDPDLACEAVVALATHYIDLRAQEPGSIRLADPAGGRALAVDRDTRHLHEYRRLRDRLLRRSGGLIGAAQGEGLLGRRRGILRGH